MYEKKNNLLIVIGITVMLIALGVFWSHRTSDNNVDNRLSDLENRITSTETRQRETTEAIQSAKGTATAIGEVTKSLNAGLDESRTTAQTGRRESEAAAESLRQTTATIDECGKLLDASAERIATCESIFERIENRNE